MPFKHMGRSEKAIDCVGLGILAARDCGWTADDLSVYGRAPRDGLLDAMLVRNCGEPVAREPVSLSDLQPGDILAIHFDGQRVSRGIPSKWPVRHVGIVGEQNGRMTLIHTDSYIGRVVEQSIDPTILSRIAAVYRRASL
ncbi:hypothetical protein [Noviluteimonas dokdonensis]|uniref:hypothetical protein n=1 Tax=Noviluteimonas dokdonensis TaxID=414050 RepID=UPI001269D87C|nr:hypothetical protein [Lysobacter dokdonensis]